MEKELVCPICGAPTRVYMGNARKDRLCGKHADELKAGKIASEFDKNFNEIFIEVSTGNILTKNKI